MGCLSPRNVNRLSVEKQRWGKREKRLWQNNLERDGHRLEGVLWETSLRVVWWCVCADVRELAGRGMGGVPLVQKERVLNQRKS